MTDLRKLLDEATPGPWGAEPMAGRGAWIKGANGDWSALSCGKTDNIAERNARLIALAPDLAAALLKAEEALERLAKLGNGDSYGNSDGNMIARATLTEIRKLTGAK